jgi:hypothetical protein
VRAKAPRAPDAVAAQAGGGPDEASDAEIARGGGVCDEPPLPALEQDPRRGRRAEDELIMHLERDQLVAETSRPVPAASLGRSALFGLWALRVFVVLVSAMVIYTFIADLR